MAGLVELEVVDWVVEGEVVLDADCVEVVEVQAEVGPVRGWAVVGVVGDERM